MKSAGRSTEGVYVLSHSMYVTILQDFGVIGLSLFASIMIAAMAGCVGRLLCRPDRWSGFALATLVVIMVENVMHPLSYSTPIIVLTIFA